MLHGSKPAVNDERTSLHRSVDSRTGTREVDQYEPADGEIACERTKRELLSDVPRAIAQLGSPVDPKPFRVVLEHHRHLPPGQPLSQPRRTVSRGDRFDSRGANHAQVAGA